MPRERLSRRGKRWKKQRPSLETLCRCLGKRKKLSLFWFRQRLPRIIKDVDNGERVLALFRLRRMWIASNRNLRLFGQGQRYLSGMPVKGCHVVMSIFFSFHMGGEISVGSGFVASIIFARLRLALEFSS
jgi:hypothetical protein